MKGEPTITLEPLSSRDHWELVDNELESAPRSSLLSEITLSMHAFSSITIHECRTIAPAIVFVGLH